MNRPRHFDVDELRERVADVFIEHGYRGTSMNMLAEASGLGKQSLYNALGDKESAYLQSVDCAAHRNAALQTVMREAEDGRSALTTFFAMAIEVSTSPDPARSTCMLTAGLMEGVDAPAIAVKLQEKWHELCMLLQQTVERGQQDRSIRADVPSAVLRDVLSTLLLGIRVSAKAASDRPALETTVRWVLKLLDEGGPLP